MSGYNWPGFRDEEVGTASTLPSDGHVAVLSEVMPDTKRKLGGGSSVDLDLATSIVRERGLLVAWRKKGRKEGREKGGK